ncbi:MAG: histidine kinase [Tetrasphaera sp.]
MARIPGGPRWVHRIAVSIAIGLILLGLLPLIGRDASRETWVAVGVIVVLALAALRPSAARTYLLLSAALVAAMVSPRIDSLWLTAAALAFLAVALARPTPPTHPARARVGPLAGVAGVIGAVGVIVALVVFGESDQLLPFVVTSLAVGAGAGLLVRSVSRNHELAVEAEHLREEATWLEQRVAMARELHDVVGHHVTAIVVQAEAGQVSDPYAALREIGDLGRRTLAELDALVIQLRDPAGSLTVGAPPRLGDIDELLAEPLRRVGVEVDVALGPDLLLDEADVLTVYRISQEGLTNVAKHSRASRVRVDVVREGADVRVRVVDDGAGVVSGRPRGSGLVGIEERVAPRGGTVDLVGRPGGGTLLDVRLPVGARDH